MQRYNPKEIEPKWQSEWAKTELYKADDNSDKPKYYALEYFPYPSGVSMHVGHVRNYVICDAYSRYKRMTGHNVLHPMGWDAFGLPAENQAIKTGMPPKESTAENVAIFKRQLTQVGLSYDWSREINSSEPDYYRWTQWLFNRFFEKGLAYKKEAPVNWCPKDFTVLANEQVIKKDGVNVCERCDTPVVKRNLSQWFLAITKYADQLLDDLEDLDWPEGIKAMQRNWIGRSTGAELTFGIDGREEKVTVFTTRPDTLFGVTFMVLAPEHELVQHITTNEQKSAVADYVKATVQKSDIDRMDQTREKTGVFTGAYAINPANDEKVPIWIADYVLTGYGTGAVMGVPGHDQRDREFARKFDLPVQLVIEPSFGEPQGDETHKAAMFAVVHNPATNKVVVLDWGPRQARYGGKMLIGGGVEGDEDIETTARREIAEETGYKNLKFIKQSETFGHGYFYSNVKNKNMYVKGRGVLFELLDEEKGPTNLDEGEDKFTVTWEPVEAVASMLDDGIHEAFYRELMLDEAYGGEGVMISSGQYDGQTSSEARENIVADLAEAGVGEEKVNYRIRDWLISRQRYWGAPIPVVHCEKDGYVAVPEDDLPVLLPELESYEPADDGRSPLARVPEFLAVDCPKCGGPAERETDTMDTFIDSSWYFLRFTDPQNTTQPFSMEAANKWMPVDMYVGGAEHAVAHLLFARFWTKFLADEGLLDVREPFTRLRSQGMIGGSDGRKMGKRYGNVVTPDDIIDQGYGADALRLFELFIAPYDQGSPWSDQGVPGTFRFLQRYWTLVQEFLDSSDRDNNTSIDLDRTIHKAIKKVSADLEAFSLNTSVAAMMEAVNELYKVKAASGFANSKSWQEGLETFTKLLAPFAPHITEEIWQQLGRTGSVHVAEWPVHDEKLLVTDEITIVVQVNGKLRAQIVVPASTDEHQILAAAKNDAKVAPLLEGKAIKREIYVPGKLVNLVV